MINHEESSKFMMNNKKCSPQKNYNNSNKNKKIKNKNCDVKEKHYF